MGGRLAFVAALLIVAGFATSRVALADVPEPQPFSVPTPTPAVFLNSPQPSTGAPGANGPAATSTSSFSSGRTSTGSLGCGGPTYTFTATAEGTLHLTTAADRDAMGVLALHGTVTATPVGEGPSFDGTFVWVTVVNGLGGAAVTHVTFAVVLHGSDGSVVTESLLTEIVTTSAGPAVAITPTCP